MRLPSHFVSIQTQDWIVFSWGTVPPQFAKWSAQGTFHNRRWTLKRRSAHRYSERVEPKASKARYLGEMEKIGIYASTRPAALPKSTHLFASHSPLLVILVWRDELLSTRLSQQSWILRVHPQLKLRLRVSGMKVGNTINKPAWPKTATDRQADNFAFATDAPADRAGYLLERGAQ